MTLNRRIGTFAGIMLVALGVGALVCRTSSAPPLSRLVLGANVAWFGMGFVFFTLRAKVAIRLLVPRDAADEVSARALLRSLPFLGGMNFAFAALSAMALVAAFAGSTPPAYVYVASGVAHLTQWLCNVPHALRGGRRGGAPWDVLRGTMLFIFVVDGACAILNAAAIAAP